MLKGLNIFSCLVTDSRVAYANGRAENETGNAADENGKAIRPFYGGLMTLFTSFVLQHQQLYCTTLYCFTTSC